LNQYSALVGDLERIFFAPTLKIVLQHIPGRRRHPNLRAVFPLLTDFVEEVVVIRDGSSRLRTLSVLQICRSVVDDPVARCARPAPARPHHCRQRRGGRIIIIIVAPNARAPSLAPNRNRRTRNRRCNAARAISVMQAQRNTFPKTGLSLVGGHRSAGQYARGRHRQAQPRNQRRIGRPELKAARRLRGRGDDGIAHRFPQFYRRRNR